VSVNSYYGIPGTAIKADDCREELISFALSV